MWVSTQPPARRFLDIPTLSCTTHIFLVPEQLAVTTVVQCVSTMLVKPDTFILELQ